MLNKRRSIYGLENYLKRYFKITDKIDENTIEVHDVFRQVNHVFADFIEINEIESKLKDLAKSQKANPEKFYIERTNFSNN